MNIKNANKNKTGLLKSGFWQGRQDLNPQQTVLETAALPIELLPYVANEII